MLFFGDVVANNVVVVLVSLQHEYPRPLTFMSCGKTFITKHKPWNRRRCISSQLNRRTETTGAMAAARFANGRARGAHMAVQVV